MFSLSPEAERLLDEARTFVGAPPLGSSPGRDAVNQAMINHWCQAFDDRNPAYAEGTAPPAMLGTWTLDAVARRDGGARDQVLRRLEEAGFDAVVATQYEHEYTRPVRVGDRLSESIGVEALSERKETALGPGYFVSVRHDYRDADGELVGVARMQLLKFQPKPRKDAGRRPTPAVNADNAYFWEGVRAGELRIQRCAACGQLRHPGRPMCGSCRSTDWNTIVASGRGVVYSHAVHHHPPLPGVELPHVIVLVELDEGVRIVSHLTPESGGEVRIGLPVEVVFSELHDELVLPLFRPRPQ